MGRGDRLLAAASMKQCGNGHNERLQRWAGLRAWVAKNGFKAWSA